MFHELKFQLSTAILAILTVAALVSAGLNLQQRNRFHLPDDGAVWVDHAAGVEVVDVGRGSPAERAGLRPGDLLLQINGTPILRAIDVPEILARTGIGNRARYLVNQRGSLASASVSVRETPRQPSTSLQYVVGVAYLVIGLFVYFRRGSAPKARHFYVFCLASFVLSCFHFTGKLNGFDAAIYFGNVAAGLLAPTIFLHFCLTFPQPLRAFRSNTRIALLYVPAGVLLAVFVAASSGILRVTMSPVELRWLLDRAWTLFGPVLYLIGGIALNFEQKKAEDPVVRQQLKWLRNGTLFGILPFTLLYVLPYVMGFVPNAYMRMSVISLALIPLTLAYAIVRYRLMDVDVIFRRGYAYTLATLCVLAGFYAVVFSLGSLVQKNFKDLSNTGLILVMLAAAFLFQPIRSWIQERLDRYFDQDRYDYRRTLVEFARELSSETDLHAMLASVAERLMKTLAIRHLAFFLAQEPAALEPQFRLTLGVGMKDRQGHPITPKDNLDLSFLNWPRKSPYLFFERTRFQLDVISTHWPASVRRTISDLDLTYYLPCMVRGRTVAYFGVSRTERGDFLSSVDVELLLTLSGYVGIAIENATLYYSLQRKVEENERLKEFSENIVESINVGILAADLDDRVESWNPRIHELTGIPRDKALGRRLSELFPSDLAHEFERVRGERGIHHIYKFVLKSDAVHAAVAASNGNGHKGPVKLREATLNIAIAPLVAKDQKQIGRLILFDDVTDRAELEQRLLQADKLSSIGLLAAGVAHEVNTPLAVISTYAQMLAKQVADDEQKSRMLEKIAKQTFRASEIVNSLLNFSRTSTTEFAQVSLNLLIQETLSLLTHQLQNAGIQVECDLEPAMPPISGNQGRLQQVFLNVFLNARDAMHEGGILQVKTWSEESGVHVEVSDTGHGISPEHLHRIYDPFFTTKGRGRGTGLGLSIAYGIIREHGGSIEASNRASGGARFHIELPWTKARIARQAVNA